MARRRFAENLFSSVQRNGNTDLCILHAHSRRTNRLPIRAPLATIRAE